eukprot:6229988-Pyramimonas_sp.AAC.1
MHFDGLVLNVLCTEAAPVVRAGLELGQAHVDLPCSEGGRAFELHRETLGGGFRDQVEVSFATVGRVQPTTDTLQDTCFRNQRFSTTDDDGGVRLALE